MEELNFSNMVCEDDVIDIQEKLQGLGVLLLSKQLASDKAGHFTYDSQSYIALNVIVDEVIRDLESLKPKVDYMQNIIRKKN